MVWYEKDNSYFIIGGQVDNSFNPHSSNEVRKYRDGHWSMVTPLPVRIKGAQSIVIQDRIFVLGNYRTVLIRLYSIEHFMISIKRG